MVTKEKLYACWKVAHALEIFKNMKQVFQIWNSGNLDKVFQFETFSVV